MKQTRYINKKHIDKLLDHKLVDSIDFFFDEYINDDYIYYEKVSVFLIDGAFFDLDCTSFIACTINEALKNLENNTKV